MSKLHHLFLLLVAMLTIASCSRDKESSYEPSTPTIHEVQPSFTAVTRKPFTVILTNTSLYATEYSWDFGDGTTSTEVSPTHRYQSKGVYIITLTAKNLFCEGTAAKRATLYDPTEIYISGFGIKKIPYQNQYYYVRVIDDDVLTTTWVKTKHVLLSSANMPYDYTLASPVLLDGLSDDEYYTMELWYSTTSSGTGTKIASYRMTKSQILEYPDSLTGSDSNASLTTRFEYK